MSYLCMPLHDCSCKEGLFQSYLLLEEVLLEVHRKNPPIALFLPVNQNITEYTCMARNTIILHITALNGTTLLLK